MTFRNQPSEGTNHPAAVSPLSHEGLKHLPDITTLTDDPTTQEQLIALKERLQGAPTGVQSAIAEMFVSLGEPPTNLPLSTLIAELPGVNDPHEQIAA